MAFPDFWDDNSGLPACEMACRGIRVRKNSPIKARWRTGFTHVRFERGLESVVGGGRWAEMRWR